LYLGGFFGADAKHVDAALLVRVAGDDGRLHAGMSGFQTS